MQTYLTPDNLDAIEKFIQFSTQKECTPSQLALAWVLHKPGVTSALIGASRPAQIEDNIQAIDIELSAEEILTLENIFEKNEKSIDK